MKNLRGDRRPTTPGEILEVEFLNEWGITQAEFAHKMGIKPSALNRLIKGHVGVTAATALMLEDLTQMPAQFWLNAQAACDLWDAQQKHVKREPISVPA